MLAEEVGDCGDSICSGVRLPSEPSLESDEGGVKGKPYVLAFVFVTEVVVAVTNVPAFVTEPSDLMVNFGIMTLWALELKIIG